MFRNYSELSGFIDFFNSYYSIFNHKIQILYPNTASKSLTIFDSKDYTGLLVLKTDDQNNFYWDESLSILLFDNLNEDYKYHPIPINRNKDGSYSIFYRDLELLFVR